MNTIFRGLCLNSHARNVCSTVILLNWLKNRLFLRRPYVIVISFYTHEYKQLERLCLAVAMPCLRDWSWLGGSYVSDTQVICCPGHGCPESADRLPIIPSHLWLIPIINMTKKLCIDRIYEKIHSNFYQNRTTSLPCLHGDVRLLPFMMEVVA